MTLRDRFAFFVVRFLLPRRWLYWAAIVVAAEASTGPFSHQDTPAVSVVDAIKRYRKSHDIASPIHQQLPQPKPE